MISKDGSHSIQAKLNLSTRLVDNYWKVDDANLLRCEGDFPSIGILLCKDKDSSVVELSLCVASLLLWVSMGRMAIKI